MPSSAVESAAEADAAVAEEEDGRLSRLGPRPSGPEAGCSTCAS